MDPVSVAIAGTAGTAAAAYLNGKYHLSKDLKVIYRIAWAAREARKAGPIRVFNANVVPWPSNYPLIEGTAQKEGGQSPFALWEKTVKTVHPATRAIWSRKGCYTFKEAHERVLQHATWLQSLGAKSGDSIGLYAPNSPEFLFVTIAMWSIGCYPAMINYNLGGASLIHCVSVAKTQILLVDAEEPGLQDRIQASESEIANLGVRPVYMTAETKEEIKGLTAAAPPSSMRKHVVGNFPYALIYTSGTTGLPKAFPFETQRVFMNSVASEHILNNRNSKTDPEDRDVWYECMPMYHGTGLVVGWTNLAMGMTLAIGKKFSTTAFWQDIHDSRATTFVYVGETARYLLSAPSSPLDKDHRLRLMYGNGLRPDVWDKFKTRFNVPEVQEFFTSTEGVFATSIYERSGYGAKSVGHHGLLFRLYFHNLYVPVALDPDTNDMWRDPKTGFAKRVPYSEGGEIICKLNSTAEWSGYHNNKEATNKKLAFDVFEKGDVYYRPGDALRRTDDGLWYFMDRLGDTFRWKGENVATTEVQEHMGDFPGIGEANVYGVEVPGSEGRAGCAAVILDGVTADSVDWKGLATHLRKKLPRYAVPIFIRVVQGESNAMGTHNNKQNKTLLRKEGVDLEKLGKEVPNGDADSFFWLTPSMDAYKPYGKAEWDQVREKRAKL